MDLSLNTDKDINNKTFLRAKEVSQLCSISVSKVWSLAREGILKPYKPTNGITLFKKDEVINAIIGAKYE